MKLDVVSAGGAACAVKKAADKLMDRKSRDWKLTFVLIVSPCFMARYRINVPTNREEKCWAPDL